MAHCDIIAKAKNGKESNIYKHLYKSKDRDSTTEIYRQVNSLPFIKWFGDWKLASKIKNDIELTPKEETRFIEQYGGDIAVLDSTIGEVDRNLEPLITNDSFTKEGEKRNVFNPLAYTSSISPESNALNKVQILEITDKLSKMFVGEKGALPYRLEYRPYDTWKGKFEDGAVVLNTAKFTLDTPFHEFGHILLEVVKINNSDLYKNLKVEIQSTDLGRATLQKIESNSLYKDNTESEILDEAIVQLMGEYAAKNQELFNANHKNLLHYIKTLFSRMSDYFKRALLYGDAMDVYTESIPPNTPLAELASYMNLNNKISIRVDNTGKQSANGKREYTEREVYLGELQEAKELYGNKAVRDLGVDGNGMYSFEVNVPLRQDIDLSGKTFYQGEEEAKAPTDRIQKLIDDQRTAYQNRKGQLEQLLTEDPDNKINVTKAISDISELEVQLEEADKKEQLVLLLNKGISQLADLNKYFEKDSNFTNPTNATYRMLHMASVYLPTFQMLNDVTLSEGNKDILNLVYSINEGLIDVGKGLHNRTVQTFGTFITSETGNESLLDDPNTVIKYLQESADISLTRKSLLSLADSRDTVLELIDKTYKRIKKRISEGTRIFKTKLTVVHDNLVNANNGKAEGMHDFMINKDKGTLVTEIDSRLHEKRSALNNTMYNEDGTKKDWKLITTENLKDASKEDIEYNKKLQKLKAKINKFTRNEIDVEGKPKDGENYKFTEGFKAERAKYEEYFGYEWRKKEGVPAQAYIAYLAKYYSEIRTYHSAVTENGQPTGAVQLKEKRFVKAEFTEPTSTWRNKKYDAIQLIGVKNPTKLQLAQRDYYNFYVDSFTAMRNRLPKSVANGMKGRMIPMAKHILNSMNESENKLKFAANYFKNKALISDDYINHRKLDESNHAIDDIPIFFTQNLKDNKKIEKLEEEFGKAKSEEKKKEIKKALQVEKAKLKPQDISTDLSQSLLAFNDMSLSYKHKKSMEGLVLLSLDIIKNKKFFIKNPDGTIKETPDGKGGVIRETIKGHESNAYKRLQNWRTNIFYDANEGDKTVTAQVAKRVMRLASLRGLGLNVFSGINNALVGRIFQHIETQGEQFYSKEARSKANSIFNKYMVGDLFTDLTNKFNGTELMSDEEPKTKIANFLYQFPFLQDQSESYSKGMAGKGFSQKLMDGDWAFVLTHVGEFSNQVRVGLSVMMDTTLTDNKGNTVPMWEAFNDKMELKEGFTLSSKEKEDITLKMEEINKVIHGRYTKEEESAVQGHWGGKLMFHFKKWMPSYLITRFDKRHYNEIIGTELEGRYRTVATFYNSLKEFNGNFIKTYENLDELGKANMRKNAAELIYLGGAMAGAFLLSALAEGVDDDDENLQKIANFLHYQDTRLITEISAGLNPIEAWQMIKNPIAATSQIEAILEFTSEMVGLPYNYLSGNPEDSYYTRGVHKGTLKVGKEFRDMLPFTVIWNRWLNFENKQDFYIK